MYMTCIFCTLVVLGSYIPSPDARFTFMQLHLNSMVYAHRIVVSSAVPKRLKYQQY